MLITNMSHLFGDRTLQSRLLQVAILYTHIQKRIGCKMRFSCCQCYQSMFRHLTKACDSDYFSTALEFWDSRVPFVNCRQFMSFSYFPFGFEGRMWDLIVSVPDHCLSFYFSWTCFRNLVWWSISFSDTLKSVNRVNSNNSYIHVYGMPV